jgi:UDP-N-acetyl-2-amino-2-deoxyglucuronate dehydrogenase
MSGAAGAGEAGGAGGGAPGRGNVTAPIRIGLVGCGAISTQHLEAISAIPDLRLVGVLDASAERARAVGERWDVPWFVSLDDLLESDGLDVVTIMTPSGLHAEQALAVLRSGRHVVVEKPIALAVADADAVVREGRDRGLAVAAISQRRFEPVVRALKAAAAGGALGRLVLVIVEGLYYRPQSYYDSAAWRGTRALDGGVLMNQAIHQVDLLRWVGGPVASVTAHLATLGHAMEAEDTASVSLRFAGGALGEIFATTCLADEQPVELRVYGDRGNVRIVGEAAAEWNVPGIPAPPPPAVADEVTPLPGLGTTQTWGTNSVGHLRQYTDFVAAVREGRPPAVTGTDGRNAIEIITAAYESDRLGRAVTLPGAAE